MSQAWYKYRRPSQPKPIRPRLSDRSGSWSSSEDDDDIDYYKSSIYTLPRGVPEALSFENIRFNQRRSPCTLRDFMSYLHHVEHNLENMQFYLWHEDYIQRFEALSSGDRALSPKWVPPNPSLIKALVSAQRAKRTSYVDPLGSPLHSEIQSAEEYKRIAEKAFEDAGIKLQPFTVQPFRDEIAKVIATYIAHGSPRELNLSSRERALTLHALSQSTHPSCFLPVRRPVEDALRLQSHPAFIRYTMDNCNIERKVFGYTLAAALMILSTAYAIIMTLSHYGRWYRALGLIFFFPGLLITLVGVRGVCIILFCRIHRQQLVPWDMAAGHLSGFSSDSSGLEKGHSLTSTYSDDESEGMSITSKDPAYEDTYQKIPYYLRIFASDKKVEEPVLMECQNNLVKQSSIMTVLISLAWAVLFVALPAGNKF